MNLMAPRMFELVDPIGVIPYAADETRRCSAVGFTDYRTPTSRDGQRHSATFAQEVGCGGRDPAEGGPT